MIYHQTILHLGGRGVGGGGNKVHYVLETATATGTSPKEVACKVGVKRGGERRGKGGEIGERRRKKSFSPPPSTFLCMPRRLGYQRNETHTHKSTGLP